MKTHITGWLRLWVVVSAFWVAGVCVYTINQYWLAATPKTALVGHDVHDSKKVRVLVSSDVTEEEAKTLIDAKIIPELNRMKSESMPTEITWPFVNRKENRKQELISLFVLFGLLPSVVLFALGNAFLWVRNGFKNISET